MYYCIKWSHACGVIGHSFELSYVCIIVLSLGIYQEMDGVGICTTIIRDFFTMEIPKVWWSAHEQGRIFCWILFSTTTTFSSQHEVLGFKLYSKRSIELHESYKQKFITDNTSWHNQWSMQKIHLKSFIGWKKFEIFSSFLLQADPSAFFASFHPLLSWLFLSA